MMWAMPMLCLLYLLFFRAISAMLQRSTRDLWFKSTERIAAIGLSSLGFALSVTAVGKKVQVLETDKGIKYIEIKPGAGAFPMIGDIVLLGYTGFLSNGTVFDSTEAPGRKPIGFTLGKRQVVEGVENVVTYMRPGGIVTCTIPSSLAFGSRGVCLDGQGCLVPPNETLKYVLKLYSVGSGYN